MQCVQVQKFVCDIRILTAFVGPSKAAPLIRSIELLEDANVRKRVQVREIVTNFAYL